MRHSVILFVLYALFVVTSVYCREHELCPGCRKHKYRHQTKLRKERKLARHHRKDAYKLTMPPTLILNGYSNKPMSNMADTWNPDVMMADQALPYQRVCSRPCNCVHLNNCKGGQTLLKDGCGCCYMCARQQGDLCDHRDLCDPNRNLYCDETIRIQDKGVCRVRLAKNCEFYGNVYLDGEHFKQNCSQVCTCQDGQVTCSSTCPHESMTPSHVNCPGARLISIEGKCCKEWACPFHHPGPLDYVDSPVFEESSISREQCTSEPTKWSPCSTTCDIGESIRVMRVRNERGGCDVKHERRLCLVRPCSLYDEQLTGSSCKATTRADKYERIFYQDCVSQKSYRPRYCSTCRRDKCCLPSADKTVAMEFDCAGSVKTFQFAWTKACECFSSCEEAHENDYASSDE